MRALYLQFEQVGEAEGGADVKHFLGNRCELLPVAVLHRRRVKNVDQRQHEREILDLVLRAEIGLPRLDFARHVVQLLLEVLALEQKLARMRWMG